MELDIKGKVALITGSSKGIGFSIAQALYKEGCNVVLNGRNAMDLIYSSERLNNSMYIQGDVTKPNEAKQTVEEVLKKFQKLDILICNVGNGQSVKPGNETYDEWQRIFLSNLWSTTNSVEAATDALEASKGNIVCISSICGLEMIPGAPVTYSAAKAALNSYVRGISRPLGKKGIRINAVAPGNIIFDGSVWEKKNIESPEETNKMLATEVSLNRFGKVKEVANLVTFLASPRSDFVTGSVWTMDGGQIRS